MTTLQLLLSAIVIVSDGQQIFSCFNIFDFSKYELYSILPHSVGQLVVEVVAVVSTALQKDHSKAGIIKVLIT